MSKDTMYSFVWFRDCRFWFKRFWWPEDRYAVIWRWVMRIGFLEIRRFEDRPLFALAKNLERKHIKSLQRQNKKVAYVKIDGEYMSRETLGEVYESKKSR